MSDNNSVNNLYVYSVYCTLDRSILTDKFLVSQNCIKNLSIIRVGK